MNHATEHIASAFKAARERKAISQRELSARAGVPQAQISRFESGAVDIRLSSLVSLARALDLEIELVPRKAVSAVESIVRSTTSGERNSDAIRAAAIEVSKLTRAIKAAHIPDLPSLQTDKVLANLRMLERFQPTGEQLEAIRKFNDVLEKAKSLSIDPDVFARHAKMIEQARNQLAHAPPPASLPKPAYALDDDDEDDA
jgi:predicted transcriptional regulator